jgi:RNA polymerase sigma-70 factor (ECF subfamily)
LSCDHGRDIVTGACPESTGLIEVLQRHSDALARFARRLVGSQDDAEEIVQEALLRTYANRMRRSRMPRELKNSVYRITHNLSVDHLRKKRVHCMDREALDLRPNPRATMPDELLYVESLRAAVRQAVDGLPQKYRDVISLRFGLGLTYRMIARTLGVRLPTVESRLHRAKARLRRELQPWATPIEVAEGMPLVRRVYAEH